MRIAVWHNLNSGGAKRALYYHIKGLIERGHSVVSFCPDTADQSYLPISDLTQESIFPLKNKINRRTRKLKHLNSPQLVHEKFQSEIEHCIECSHEINAGNFDVLFANSSTSFFMSHIGRFVTIPTLIYLGEPNRFLYESGEYFVWRAPITTNNNAFKYWVQRIYQVYKMFWYSYIVREELISAQSYNEILVNSFFSRESVKRAYSLDSKVCYLGIDTDKFSLKVCEKKLFVMGLGFIDKHKGIEQSIDAIAMVKKSLRPLLIWIGNSKLSEYSNHLIAYAKNKEVEVIFKSNVTDEELTNYLSEACAFLYFPHLEPFGLAPLEANACGTAAISIKEGGIRETVQHGVNGFVVNDLNEMQIAHYISLFTSDLNYAQSFGEKCREYILENWNYDLGIDNIEKFLIDLIQRKKVTCRI